MKKFILSVLLILLGLVSMVQAASQTMLILDASGSMLEHVGGSSLDKGSKESLQVGEYNEFKIKNPLTITLAKANKNNVVVGQTGKMEVIALETKGGKQVKARHYIYKFRDIDKNHRLGFCGSSVDMACKKRLPIGQYFLISEYNEFKVKTPFTITAGKTKKINVVMGQTGNVEVIALGSQGGEQVKARHSILKPIDKNSNKHIRNCSSSVDKACKERLPIGSYILVSRYNEFKIKTPFIIKAGETNKIDVVMGKTGKVQLVALETDGGKQVKARHSIFQLIDEDYNKHIRNCSSFVNKACIESLPVGDYLVVSRYNEFKIKTPFIINSGEINKINVVMGKTGKVQIVALETEGGKQVKARHDIFQVIDKYQNKYIRGFTSYVDKVCNQSLPVGDYLVVSRYNEFKIKTPFSISPGEINKINVVMGQTGKVQVAAFETAGGKEVQARHNIFQVIDQDRNNYIRNCSSYFENVCKQSLPVGKYLLVSRYNEFKIKTPFIIKAGETNKINVVMGQTGKIQVVAFETAGGKQVQARHNIFQIIDKDHDLHIRGCSSYVDKVCKERLPIGEYFLISNYKRSKVKTPFIVKTGKTTKLMINIDSKSEDQ